MTKIGLLSDTHGFLDPKLVTFFKECQEVWHAGDIGNPEILEKIRAIAPYRAVFGNIDGRDIRALCPEHWRFRCEEVDVWLTHIGGYPGRYDKGIRNDLFMEPPDLFICGHSHILKVAYDKGLEMLHINPGAAGRVGMHLQRTAIRFEISGKEIKNLEVVELGLRSVSSPA
jgi:hypothetical protein